MTKDTKRKILHHLHFLKSIGFNYYENIDLFKNQNQSSINLPNNLQALEDSVKNCFLCELSKSRKNVVFADGNINTDIMFISDIPSVSDDEMGKVFVGRSGEVLTNMIQNVLKIKREDVYITNFVKCKPSNNKVASQSEVDTCSSYIFKQIELVKPKLIVALGQNTYTYLTKETTDITKIRGQVQNYKDTQLIATYHPSFLLRNPSSKKEAFYDMLKIKDIMGL